MPVTAIAIFFISLCVCCGDSHESLQQVVEDCWKAVGKGLVAGATRSSEGKITASDDGSILWYFSSDEFLRMHPGPIYGSVLQFELGHRAHDAMDPHLFDTLTWCCGASLSPRGPTASQWAYGGR